MEGQSASIVLKGNRGISDGKPNLLGLRKLVHHFRSSNHIDNTIDLVLSIPNLRKFICSPWTDLEKMVAAVGDRYCIEWRQKATDVAFAPDLSPIREHLERGLRIAQGTPIQIVLQELETVDGNPQRLKDWAAAAKEIGAALA